jgi:hypothetical protein
VRSIFSELLGPSGLILLAAAIGGVGAFWSAMRQADLRKKSEGNAAEQVELLRDISARGGNEQVLEDLIRARSRALNGDRAKADDIADGIIKRLPELTAEFKALEKNKLDMYQQKAAEFRLKWEPLIQWFLTKLDSLVAGCQERGVNLRVLDVPFRDFPFTAHLGGQMGSYKIREVQLGDTKLYLEYESLGISDTANSGGYRNAQLTVYVAGNIALRLTLGMDNGDCAVSLSGAQSIHSGQVAAPKDGVPSNDFSKFVEDGFEKVFERFLVVGNAGSETARPK